MTFSSFYRTILADCGSDKIALTIMDSSDENSLEVLSTLYQPERSIHVEYTGVTGAAGRSALPDNSLRAIRSVDDYERPHQHRPVSYYFRTRSEGGGGTGSLSRASSSEVRPARKSMPAYVGVTVRSSMPLFRNGDTLLLPMDGTPLDSEKEPLSADEKKRKRITLAVGIIAGLLIVASILLVAVTLNMTSKIDAIVKEQSDNSYAQLTSSKGDYGTAWKNSTAQRFPPILQYSSRDN